MVTEEKCNIEITRNYRDYDHVASRDGLNEYAECLYQLVFSTKVGGFNRRKTAPNLIQPVTVQETTVTETTETTGVQTDPAPADAPADDPDDDDDGAPAPAP